MGVLRWRISTIELLQGSNNFVHRVDEGEELHVLRTDVTFFDQKIKVDGLAPKLGSHQNNRYALDFSGLHQRQHLK